MRGTLKDIDRRKSPWYGEQVQLKESGKGKKSVKREEEDEEAGRREEVKKERALGKAAVKSQTKPRRRTGH